MNSRSYIHIVLLLTAQLAAYGASTQFYGLALGRRYIQTNTATPTFLPSKAFESRAFVYATTTTTGSIKKPNNSTLTIPVVGDHLELTSLYDVPALLTSAWPLGNYTLNISNPTDGAKTPTMYIGGDFYPTPARVSNFVEAQSMFPGQNFVLRWDGVTGPAPSDLIEFRLEENGVPIFETAPIPGATGALNGSATSVTIPANRLSEGRVYSATITVWRAVTRNTTTIPGAQGQTAYLTRTTFPLRTRFLLQDVINYGVEKRVMYEQTGAGPTLLPNGYEMTAFLTASTTQSVTSASFRPAASGTITSLASAGTDFSFVRAFASPPAMDGAFPPGGFEMRITTKNNGFRTNTLPLAGAYPQNAPQILNIDEAQYIKTASPFTVSWNVTEAQASDLFQVIVMDGAFPPGGFEMRITTKNNGFRTNTLPLTGAYPQNAPQLLNIDEAQYIKTASPFTVSWNVAEAQASDLFQVIVMDGTNVVFSTPAVPGIIGALNGSTRSVSVPAGTLLPGKTYSGMIRHARIAANDSFTYPQAQGVSSHARVTRFPMSTATGPSPAPTLVAPARINNQSELAFDSIRGEKYTIHMSTGLPVWSQGPTVTAAGTMTLVRLPASPAPFTFYRIATAP